jgi:hypothetical protein
MRCALGLLVWMLGSAGCWVVGCGGKSVQEGALDDAAAPDAAVEDGTTGVDAAPGPAHPGPVDAGTATDDGPVDDVGSCDAGGRAIACASGCCEVGSGVCCYPRRGGAACTAPTACLDGMLLECSSAASCAAGQVCCFGRVAFGLQASRCMTECGAWPFAAQICATDAECGAKAPCGMANKLVGDLRFCEGFGPIDAGAD